MWVIRGLFRVRKGLRSCKIPVEVADERYFAETLKHPSGYVAGSDHKPERWNAKKHLEGRDNG